jgi:hypothetical protein
MSHDYSLCIAPSLFKIPMLSDLIRRISQLIELRLIHQVIVHSTLEVAKSVDSALFILVLVIFQADHVLHHESSTDVLSIKGETAFLWGSRSERLLPKCHSTHLAREFYNKTQHQNN